MCEEQDGGGELDWEDCIYLFVFEKNIFVVCTKV
jgi:hypothetical protein